MEEEMEMRSDSTVADQQESRFAELEMMEKKQNKKVAPKFKIAKGK